MKAARAEVILGGRTRLRQALIAAGEPIDDDTVNREWAGLFKDPFRAEARAEHHMQHLADLLPRVTQSLLDRSWFLTVYKRKALATSDHPVYVVPNEQLTRMGMGTGIENATVIHAPLTRRHSLAMYQPSAVPPQLAARGRDIRWPGVTATALYSNSCTVNSARRFLFHHPDDAPLAGFDLPQGVIARLRSTPSCGAGSPRTTARCSWTPGSALTTSLPSWSSSGRVTGPPPVRAMAPAR